jgi:class 3 adenylate cyclase
MLFADVKNFSKLREEQAPAFFQHFLREVAKLIEQADEKPSFQNTWGDGLFLVFDHVLPCTKFAWSLLRRIGTTNWARWGLPEDTTVRIGLHAGPVYPRLDHIIGRRNFFGSHVNRAARIEPITTPGCAFTTEQFAAMLAMEPNHAFRCAYVGVEDLAKGYDRCALYRLEGPSG